MRHPDSAGLIDLPTGRFSARSRTQTRPEQDSSAPKSWFRIENKADTDTPPEVYIYDEIGGWGISASDFVKEITALDVGSFNLHINSPGGEVFDGVAIYNAIKMHQANVTVYVDSLAASAASFIAQAGDEVIMAKASTMMIHDGAGFTWGNAQAMRDTANILDKISNNIAAIYATRAGGTTESWRALMQEEVWYNAQEAVDAGLADSVQGDGTPAENSWNLSVFNHAGRGDAPSPMQVGETISNRVKENSVANKVKNEAVAPEVTPEPATDPVVEPVVPLEETEPIVAPVAEVAPVFVNRAPVSLLINGVPEADPSKIQAYIDGLQQFAQESKDTARQAFVNKLVTDNKITAPQADAFVALAMSLDDAQYALWTAPWDAAPSLSLFAKHASGVTNLDGSQSDDKADRIKVLEGIVDHHRNSGMAEAELVTKKSFIELQQLTSPTQS